MNKKKNRRYSLIDIIHLIIEIHKLEIVNIASVINYYIYIFQVYISINLKKNNYLYN